MSARRGLAGSSALMFSGTLVSRLLGMVREPLLLGAAIGINYGAANAFAVANRLPNLIHLLIAGGVLNAVLVPQIVRAMTGHTDGGQQYVNRLLTVSAAVLGAVTVLLTAAATILVSLYASELPPQWFDLAVVFAVWTIPQLFFYGMYTVLGQVLNARGNFGPYMWAPAANNVVAIAGLVVYLVLYGGVGSGPAEDASAWTTDRVAVLAGTATLGVVAQAVILIWPLHRSGFRFRPEWGLRGSGLGRASRVAMWVFGSVLVGQLVNILVIRAAVHAANRGGGALDVPGPAAYNPAYTLFILPNSLVVVSLITALFTRMSSNAATGRLSRVRDDLSLGLRTVGLFTVFGTGALMVLALPIMRVLTATVSYEESQSIARVAVAMLAGLVGMGALTVVQRVYYAFEDTRRMFWIQLPAAGIVAVGAVAAMFVPPQWTLVGVGMAMTVSNTVAAAVSFLSLRRHLPSLDGGRVLRAHVRLTLAAAPAALLGWGLLHLLGVSADDLTIAGAAWRTVLVGTVMGLLYLLLLLVMRVEELTTLLRAAAPVLRPVTRRLPAGAQRVLQHAGLPAGRDTSDGGGPPPVAMPAGPTSAPPPDTPGAVPVRTLGSTSPKTEDDASTGSGTLSGRDQEHSSPLGVTVLGERYQLGAPLPATLPRTTRWRALDLILDRDVEATVLHPQDERTPAVLDAARRAATVEDPRLLAVLDVGDDERSTYLVTDPLPGTALTDIVAAEPLPVDQARALVGEVASALESARRQGVQHLSLRPEAVRVTADDRVVVTGLALDAVLLDAVHDDVVASSRQDAVDLVRILYLALT
ncbi:lipid II flippase MurJ, partial [Georgenia sp. 10Sc9-8]|nr:lipid II flippase MurJ [Georgenia halotolerans]